VKIYNPINSVIQEYLVEKLCSLTPEQYRLLNEIEKKQLFTRGSVVTFVKKNQIFRTLSVLSKVGINWGIYIIDSDFDYDKYEQVVKNKEFLTSGTEIRKALQDKKAFITNNKFFIQIQNLLVNAYHGLDTIWDLRFIKMSKFVSRKTKNEFDSYSITSEEVEYKTATMGGMMMLDIFRNLSHLGSITKKHGLLPHEFIMLCEFYYNSAKYYTKKEVSEIQVGNDKKPFTTVSALEKKGFLIKDQKAFNISSNGCLVVGEIMSKFMSHLYLE